MKRYSVNKLFILELPFIYRELFPTFKYFFLNIFHVIFKIYLQNRNFILKIEYFVQFEQFLIWNINETVGTTKLGPSENTWSGNLITSLNSAATSERIYYFLKCLFITSAFQRKHKIFSYNPSYLVTQKSPFNFKAVWLFPRFKSKNNSRFSCEHHSLCDRDSLSWLIFRPFLLNVKPAIYHNCRADKSLAYFKIAFRIFAYVYNQIFKLPLSKSKLNFKYTVAKTSYFYKYCFHPAIQHRRLIHI